MNVKNSKPTEVYLYNIVKFSTELEGALPGKTGGGPEERRRRARARKSQAGAAEPQGQEGA
eukprot:scaffold11206_cov117-Isochrysis_galbana.AAC.5